MVNLSQRGSTTEIDFQPTGQVPAINAQATIEAAVRARYRNTNDFDGSRDGLIIDSVHPDGDTYSVTVRTARPLTVQQREALTRNLSNNGSR